MAIYEPAPTLALPTGATHPPLPVGAPTTNTGSAVALNTGDDYYVLNYRGVALIFVCGATAQTVTIETPVQIEGLDVANKTLALAINEVRSITLEPTLYNRFTPPGVGRVKITSTGAGVVTMYVVQIY